MKKLPTIENFSVCVPWQEVKDILGKVEFKYFEKWMTGQTTAVHGVWPHDLERYLYFRQKGFKIRDITVLD